MNASAWKRLALLLAAALAIRIVAGLYWQSRLPDRFGFGDSASYWTLGRAMARGQPYEVGTEKARIFRTPGYPLLLAPIFKLSAAEPSVIWARAQNAVMGTLAVGAVYLLAYRLFDARCGLIAATLVAFYPGAIATSALVLSEAPFSVLMLAQLVLWTAAWRAASPRQAALLGVGAGAVAALATLVRPSWLLFTPLALAVGLLLDRLPARRRHNAWIAMGMMVGLVAAMMPWWLRNAGLTGRFVPTTLQVGASLYDGWNPKATGASNMEFVPKFVEDQRRQEPAGEQREPGFEYRLDRQLRSEALAWARAHPGRAIRLAFIKLGRTWNVWPNEPAFSRWPLRLTVFCTFVPLMLLGIAGAARTIRCGWPYILCWLPAVYFSILHMVFVGSIRYRQPAMLGLIVLAAGVIGSWKPGRGSVARQIAMEGRLPSSDD